MAQKNWGVIGKLVDKYKKFKKEHKALNAKAEGNVRGRGEGNSPNYPSKVNNEYNTLKKTAKRDKISNAKQKTIVRNSLNSEGKKRVGELAVGVGYKPKNMFSKPDRFKSMGKTSQKMESLKKSLPLNAKKKLPIKDYKG